MNGGHEQIFGSLNVPTGESRAKLTELGISEEEQGQRLSCKAAGEALGKVAVGGSKILYVNTESAKRLFEKYYRPTMEACIGQIL